MTTDETIHFQSLTTACLCSGSPELRALYGMPLFQTSGADCSMTVAAIGGRSWERDLGVAVMSAPNGKPLFVLRDNYLLGESFYRLIQEDLTSETPFTTEEKLFYRRLLKKIARTEEQRGRRLQIGGVKESVEKLLSKLDLVGRCLTNEDLWDYCYAREAFATLTGRPMAKKRNFCRRFERNHPNAKFVYFDRSPEEATLERWRAFLAAWYDANQPLDETLFFERKFLEVILSHWNCYGLTGGMLVDGEEILGLTLGAPVTDSVYAVHIEKALRGVDGAYPYLAHSLAKALPETLTVLNREEDLGVPGLRKAKHDWSPLYQLEKGVYEVEAFDL